MARGAKNTWTGGSFWWEWAKEHGTDALPPAGRKALGFGTEPQRDTSRVTAGRDPAHSNSEASADSHSSSSADDREPAGGTPSLQPAGSIPVSTSPKPDPLPSAARAKHASDHAPAGSASDVPATVTEPAARPAALDAAGSDFLAQRLAQTEAELAEARAELAALSSISDAQTGRMTIVVGRPALARLDPLARRNGMTAAALTARVVMGWLSQVEVER